MSISSILGAGSDKKVRSFTPSGSVRRVPSDTPAPGDDTFEITLTLDRLTAEGLLAVVGQMTNREVARNVEAHFERPKHEAKYDALFAANAVAGLLTALLYESVEVGQSEFKTDLNNNHILLGSMVAMRDYMREKRDTNALPPSAWAGYRRSVAPSQESTAPSQESTAKGYNALSPKRQVRLG